MHRKQNGNAWSTKIPYMYVKVWLVTIVSWYIIFKDFDVNHYFCHFLLFYNRIDVYFLRTCLDICLFVFLGQVITWHITLIDFWGECESGSLCEEESLIYRILHYVFLSRFVDVCEQNEKQQSHQQQTTE